jgi:hypothetical protein
MGNAATASNAMLHEASKGASMPARAIASLQGLVFFTAIGLSLFGAAGRFDLPDF